MPKLSDKLKRKADECEKLKYEYDELVDEAKFSDFRYPELFEKRNRLFRKHMKLKKKTEKNKSDRGA